MYTKCESSAHKIYQVGQFLTQRELTVKTIVNLKQILVENHMKLLINERGCYEHLAEMFCLLGKT